ncbi:hypothetical protein F2Q70_00029398 [Brassica cretica]|uniref:Uncharacterized protein n=1 Tax=Brassica cretica TaxID=69181 RepID=A0A8S9FL31_BRACR|nr:hypothetical protein F2Q70_00029398 [Brassica cretica]
MSSDDPESKDDGKVMKNLVAFGARKEESSESSNSDVDTDEEEYHSREQNEELAEELAAVNEKNESLEQEVFKLREVATGKQERTMMLECNLAENHKRIRMLNSGTKDLDKILSMGQPAKANWELGYRGAESTAYIRRGCHSSCKEAHEKVKPKKFVRKYVETYDKE